MNSEVLSFDAMPQMVATILKKLETLEQKFDALQSNNNVEADAWFSLQDLCNYLPNHPAEQTVYGWTSNRTIPYHKIADKYIVSIPSHITVSSGGKTYRERSTKVDGNGEITEIMLHK